MADTTVKVAVRIRPLVPSESKRGCQNVLQTIQDVQQIKIKDSERAFTYNYVFDYNTDQNEFYQTCVEPLIHNIYKGYNVTILAYGQTGSGKTHSMGTAYSGDGEMGIIPRAINDIFKYVNDNFVYDFNITVSFMELYQETLYDLLANKPREQCVIELREAATGIIIPGLTEQPVTSVSETLNYLINGSKGRATGSTNMNAQSSRSHAIFTISICMQKKGTSESKTAKFHLVDLAGSERSKKTGATGQTFKEGVNINKGLLALGNVISALGDEKGAAGYIGYRDSNLTRLLKDSLGGNSITLMIACVSPADYNIEETVSTLRYADRARKIKNKPVVNEDPKAAEINNLKKLVKQLQLERIGHDGPVICEAELELLKQANNVFKDKISTLTMKLCSALNEKTSLLERVMIMQASNEVLSAKLLGLKHEYEATLNNLNVSLDQGDEMAVKANVTALKNIQLQYTELCNEQHNNDTEIRNHEMAAARSTSHSNATSEVEINERQESHTAQQINMHGQLEEVTKMLAQKEHLAQQIAENTCHMVDADEVAENEAKMSALQKEKDELLQQLKNVQAQSGGSKLAEQRKKRVQELEKQIHDLNKKVQEQSKMIKLKEKDEIKIRQLNSDIQKMKQTKVKLIKDMRQESEKFRTWKIQRERELLKLKDQDRKRQNQIVQMETIHSRQQNVLKRKVEEAAAINKRLKDALALRKQAQDSKMNGKIERFGPWVKRELDVFVHLIEAQTSLANLLEDRAFVQEQLDTLKTDQSNEAEINQLEDDLQLRSSQIQDLQQKILDSDEDNKSKSRFDNISTMSEAKYVLKVLFELTADNKKHEIVYANKIQELIGIQTELETNILLKDEKIRDLQDQQTVFDIKEQECEDKVSVLLRQLRGISVKCVDEDVNQRFDIQLQTIQRLEMENDALKTKYQAALEELAKKELAEKVNKENELPEMTTAQTTPKNIQNHNSTFIKDLIELGDLVPTTPCDSSFEDHYEDDMKNDPDWRKTPLGLRIQKFRASEVMDKAVKRTSGGGCNCRAACMTRACKCKKLGLLCTKLCKCAVENCVNHDPNATDSSEEKGEDVTFKKPRDTCDTDHPRIKRTKKLFQ